MANKMIDLSNIARLAAALDSRMRNKIEEEELRAKEEESNLLQAIKEVEEMLGGKSLIYLTQAEYDVLAEEEKNNESIMYIITDAEDISHEHDNLEFLNSLNETDYMQLGTDIEALKNNKVDEAEYNSKISELTTNINNEIDRATEKESEILADTTSKITEVENMLGGKSFVYLTQAEYDELTEEEKSNDEIIYFITDAQDASHTHDNKEFLDGLSEDNFEEISNEIGALETSMSNEVSRVEAMLGGRSFVYLTQAEYDALSEEDKNDETKIYVVTDTVSVSHVHNNKEFLDSLNEDIFNDINSAIQLLENNKLDASIYNEVVPGLVDNSHTHENQDFLDELNEEEFAQMNADIAALKTSVSGKADTEHNHDDKYYTESEIDEKIEDINESINGHVSTLQGLINTAKSGAISESKTYTDTAITNLVDSAPDAMNTLNDLAKAINAHQTEYEAYVATVSSNITSAKNEAINEAGNKDEALHAIISKEIDDDVKEEHDRAVGVETGLQASITTLTNNKVDVAKYNDEVPGLLTAKHNHENLDVLNSLTSEKISGYDASIKSLQDNKLDAATYNTDMVDLNAAKHTHENKAFLDTFTETEYNEIVSLIETLFTNKLDTATLEFLIYGSGEAETEAYKIRYLCQGDKIVSPMVNMATVVADDGSDLVEHIDYFYDSIESINAAIGDGNELLTDAKDTVVHCINELQTEINGLQGDVNEFESALETVDAIKLNGYSIWVGTTEELSNVVQRDPNTLYFEISDEEDSEEVVQVDPVDGVLTLTTNKYQKTTIEDGTEIVFPEVNKFTEIHLYFDAESAMNLTFPECKWRVDPNIEAGKSYEIVATYNTVHWLVNVIVYS